MANAATISIETLDAVSRTAMGKTAAKTLRNTGQVPAIINNDKGMATHIAVDVHRLNIMHQRGLLISSVFDIKIDNKKTQHVFVREVQQNYLNEKVDHIDFQEITQRNKARVSIYFTNASLSPGIKRGGIVNIMHRHIWCYCPKNNIIKSIEFDISQKKIGDFIRIHELPLPKGVVAIIKNPNAAVASIVGKKGKQNTEEEAATAPVEKTVENTEKK